jgi:UDP-glucose:tetrahydrobiopterin glucosyltransferase
VGHASVAVVTPPWDEPFGLVVIEALACGTPVAALARGAMTELVDAEVGRSQPTSSSSRP